MSDSDSVMIGDYFSLGNKIGTGSFGDIYDGENIETKERVGIKLEPTDVRHAQLPNESKIYQQVQGCPGFPRMYHYGKQGRYFVLVMELLGKSLDDYCSQHEKEPFSNEQVMGLALQILDRLEVLHSKGLVYRDIKPANFLFGRDSSSSSSSSSETTSTTSSSSSSSSSNSDSAVSTSVSPSTSSASVSSVSSDSSSSSSTSSASSSASSSSSPSSSSEQQTATTSSSSSSTPTKYITLPSAPLYLIDFGLTRPVKDSSHHHHHHNSSGDDLSALGLERKHSSSPHHSPHNSTDKSSPVSSSSSAAAASTSSPHTLSPSSAASSSSSSASASASSTTTGSSYRFKEPKKSNSGGLVGTARYASIAAHEGRHLSQRDDLESVVYVLIFMLRGELPWQSVRGRERQDIYDQIGLMKREITMRDLCLGVPTSILAMMMYVKTMEYGQHPDYPYLKQLFSPQNSASTSLVTKDTLSLTLSREPSNSSHHSPVSTVSSISGSGLLSAAHSRTSSMESSGSSTISSSPMIIPYSQQQHTLPSHKSSKSAHTTPSSSPPAPPSQMLSRAGTPEYLLNKSNPHIPLRTHSPSPSPASSASSSGFDPLAMLGLSRHFTDGKTTTSNTSHSLLSSHHHHHGGSPSQKGGHGHTSSHSPPPTISRGKSSEPVKWEQKFKI